MKSESEIQQRISELMCRRRKEFRDEFLGQYPRNCSFNTRFRIKDQGQVGFCQSSKVLNALDAKVFVCNEQETAEQCKIYRCRNTEDSVQQRFDDILCSPSRCGEKFPKLAVLIWAIQNNMNRTRWGRFCSSLGAIRSTVSRFLSVRWW